jgi:hypothetical protein
LLQGLQIHSFQHRLLYSFLDPTYFSPNFQKLKHLKDKNKGSLMCLGAI